MKNITFTEIMSSIILLVILLMAGCNPPQEKSMEVTATAYNSLAAQTHKNHPALTAWGDTLKPGMKAIAVSRDLIDSGLIYGTEVKIEGLTGTYTVRDKMNKRWRQKIDIYMGTSIEKALEWGKKKVTIRWKEPK
ncbi:MAG: 3D domain-containing protein [Bacteroidales bacterium]|nr:3D domain-containing protein [Bacteroidales bacterium]MCF8333917.1 3D domain-containing protein [Bacteroidales bacterium]